MKSGIWNCASNNVMEKKKLQAFRYVWKMHTKFQLQ